MKLNLKRPIVFFDLETTGLNIVNDRIVEIAMLKITPDGEEILKTHLINPGIPIPPFVTTIHGISDDDVKNKPLFKQIAGSMNDFLKNCDLAGFNALRFDIPLLAEEFLRAGVDFTIKDRNIVDVQNIFHKMEQRTLEAAYRFYCNKILEGAHSAEADTKATYEVLKAQLDRYENISYTDRNGKNYLPVINDMNALSDFSAQNKNADLAGMLIYDERNDVVFNFGKYKGKSVIEQFKTEPQYYDWIMKSNFPLYTKKVLQELYFKTRSSQGFLFT
ncbi:MAG: 3'-5' exonuclease [Bacteroidales bacterium]|nr:3'-5' exonuclease [Bacteroidales bacterium]HPE86142.1 3'-5' exonuclease [Bacteroidales bacterium]